jgi:hypothetical protein
MYRAEIPGRRQQLPPGRRLGALAHGRDEGRQRRIERRIDRRRLDAQRAVGRVVEIGRGRVVGDGGHVERDGAAGDGPIQLARGHRAAADREVRYLNLAVCRFVRDRDDRTEDAGVRFAVRRDERHQIPVIAVIDGSSAHAGERDGRGGRRRFAVARVEP